MSAIMQWHYGASILIPAGIIMPFNGVAGDIPSDWEHWTDGANRAFRASSTGSGSTGGNTYVARTSASGGSHTGTQETFVGDTSSGSSNHRHGAYSAGSHSHSLRINYTPGRRYQVMMRALKDLRKFPVNTGFLADTDMLSGEGLSDVTVNGYMLYGASGTSSSTSNSSKTVSNCNSAGSHHHASSTALQGGTNTAYTTNNHDFNRGAAAHSGSASVTDNMYRYYMSMWASASKEMAAIEGMYGLWESATPPDGWAICDGNNGTPNLNNYHIGLDRSKQGTKSGNGTITTSGSLNSAGSHHHRINSVSAPDAYGRHGNNVSHTHSIGSASSSYSPQYRTIVFIKAIG